MKRVFQSALNKKGKGQKKDERAELDEDEAGPKARPPLDPA